MPPDHLEKPLFEPQGDSVVSSATILIVDDEPSIVEVVSLYLQRSGYQVLTAIDGPTAMQMLLKRAPDLVILDLMLPGIDGLEITRRLRAEGNTPIIMLTARREQTDRILGLEMGADDYVIKPFSPQELVSRVRAVLRRVQQTPTPQSERPLQFDQIQIDPATRLVHASGREITLTAKEFDLLWFLANHPRQVFNRLQILDRVWGERLEYLDPSTVTVHVRRLAKNWSRIHLTRDISIPSGV